MLADNPDSFPICETGLQPRSIVKVRQRTRTDCGVACLAMLAHVPYERAYSAFEQAGLTVHRKGKRPLSSNFRDLIAAAATVHLNLAMSRFTNWDAFHRPAIIKTSSHGGPKQNWHWVVAVRTPRGIEVLDPGTDLPSYENPPDGVFHIPFEMYTPTGNVLG